MAIFLFFEGMYFSTLYSYGSPNVEVIYASLSTVVMLVTPVITMRLLSEDRRQKVDQALLTAPVSVGGIVMGKFLGAFSVFALAFSPCLLFELIVSVMAKVNWLVFLNGTLGVLLVGAALIAIGMFISALTESPIISCILTLLTFLLLMVLPNIASLAGIEWISAASKKIAFLNLISNFTESVFHVVDVIFLASIAVVFIFLSIRAVEKRRWA